MDAKYNDSDLLGEPEVVSESANPLHTLQQEIAAMPAVDLAKIEAALNKLQSGKLGILGTEAEREASALRIAAAIAEESLDLNSILKDTD